MAQCQGGGRVRRVSLVRFRWGDDNLTHEFTECLYPLRSTDQIFCRTSSLESVMKIKWCDLFILGLMQSADHVGLRRMLDAMSSHLSACSKIGQLKQEKFEEVDQQIKQLLQLVQRFDEVKLSAIEFAYLKLISFTANGPFYCICPE